jgi:hypothetical protein
MRRLFFTVVASVAVLALGSAVAVARSHNRAHHHHRSHHRHARVHHHRFGTDSATAPSTASAGTVTSFTGGVLTITLSDGTTVVSGKVTDATELDCETGTPGTPSVFGGDSHDSGGLSGGDGDDTNGDNNGDNNNSGVDENGGGDEQACTTAALTPGAVVREAELSVSSAGAIWQKVELGA